MEIKSNQLYFDPSTGDFKEVTDETEKVWETDPSKIEFWNFYFATHNIPIEVIDLHPILLFNWQDIVLNHKDGFIAGWNLYFKILKFPIRIKLIEDKEQREIWNKNQTKS